tara:strand:- start:119 stop:718 length:600 start_codon:yes stop_codon:yes gene_type:complete
MTPAPPESPPSPGIVVLGRFQPFHRGHETLLVAAEDWRRENAEDLSLIIAIGSSNRQESLQNPWSADERSDMVEAWLSESGIQDVKIVSIPDIEDPPNWVSHAEQYHGMAGVLFTSNLPSVELYEAAGWQVLTVPLENRESFEGWRVRETARMLSTIGDEEAVRAVLSQTIPSVVVQYLVSNDALRRLAFLGEGGEPVG